MYVYILVCTINGEKKMCMFDNIYTALKFVRTATNETRIHHGYRVDEFGTSKQFHIGFQDTLLFVAVDEVFE